jgi:hypothetical protein
MICTELIAPPRRGIRGVGAQRDIGMEQSSARQTQYERKETAPLLEVETYIHVGHEVA